MSQFYKLSVYSGTKKLCTADKDSTLECEPQPGSVSDEPRALAFMDGMFSLVRLTQSVGELMRQEGVWVVFDYYQNLSWSKSPSRI